VRLALPLPYVAIDVIKIVSGDVANGVELEEVGLCVHNAEQRQKPPHEHRGAGRRSAPWRQDRSKRRDSPLPFI